LNYNVQVLVCAPRANDSPMVVKEDNTS
jgi:hypothetical protein